MLDQLDAELGRDLRVLVGVVGDEAHAERCGEAEHLGADIAHAELAQGLADHALAHVVRALGPALRTLAAEPVLDQQLLGQRQDEGQDRDRDRAAHAVGRDAQRDAGLGAGRDVDAVVADAEAGDDGEPAVRRHARLAELRHQQDQRVAAREPLGRHHAVDRVDEDHLDLGIGRQRREVEAGIGRAAVRLAEVAAERHAEPAHAGCSQAARMPSTPALTAAW